MLYEKVSYNQGSSLIARWNKSYYFNTPLHFHDEFELIYVVESFGVKYVGDSKELFKEGELVLMGSKLPHAWVNDGIFTQNLSGHRVKAVIVQFESDFRDIIDACPEFLHISQMLKQSQRGLVFSKEIANQNKELLLQLPDIQNGFERIILVLKLLQQLAVSGNYRQLASLSYQNIDSDNSLNRIIDTLKYISENYQKKLYLSEISSQFNMSTTAFCNYFKRKTGKTLINYINELRVSKAGRLINNSEKSITEIAFECGFNNLSNFNRIFKSITGKTPKEYRILWSKTAD